MVHIHVWMVETPLLRYPIVHTRGIRRNRSHNMHLHEGRAVRSTKCALVYSDGEHCGYRDDGYAKVLSKRSVFHACVYKKRTTCVFCC